ncbi:SDR family NAD(P)-dependent oxidoreductase [Colwelliaceae bacterium BS250]
MTNQRTLIIGANSNIAQAIATQILNDADQGLILISRDLSTYQNIDEVSARCIPVENYSLQSIKQAVELIPQIDEKPITKVFICNGILHTQDIKPEKRLEDLDVEAFNQVITTNTLMPMLWIQQLTPLLTGNSACKLVVFSARVGSISDNRLGGWYTYRASKAALNMMLKTAAIELARRAKNIKIIAFHPGTTDTPLSKPFQNNVPAGKLFTSEFVAEQLLTIVDNTDIDGKASYLDWQGKAINW